ncbi:hypothetical protein PRJ_5527 (plasmid) [Pseudomonas sp. XWY-1]|nr:hypothetical protein PRJ_5527 [Pseudomonas sp. XWY-1]
MAFVFPIPHNLSRLVFFEIRREQLKWVIQIRETGNLESTLLDVA